jgi:hypothetical protein
MRIQINDRLSTMALQKDPENAEFKALDERINLELEEFELPSYQEYLDQEKQMEEIKRTQDSLVKANNKSKTTAVSLDGPNGLTKK